MKEKEQTLERAQLIKLRYQFDCSLWKQEIEKILVANLFNSNHDVVIPKETIDLLLAKGGAEQKQAVQKLGIIFLKTQEELYLEKHDASGFKVGDQVKITRIAESKENGWENSWEGEMNNYIGEILTIIRDNDTSGFRCENEANNHNFNFPYFVLEKVVVEYVPFDFSDDLLGKTIISKDKFIKGIISYQTKDYINNGYHQRDYKQLFRDYTFLDGTPCGRLK